MIRIEQDENGMVYMGGAGNGVEMERLTPSEVSEVESLMESDPGEPEATESSLMGFR